MLNHLKQIQMIINEELILINKKINGVVFLDILKYKLIDRLKNIFDKFSSETIKNFDDENVFEDEQRKISIRLYASENIIINKNVKTEKNTLLIPLKENLNIYYLDVSKKRHNIKCIPMTGIIFPSHTNYTFNIEKNSVIIEISLDDKIQDIEKLKDSTI